MRSTLKAMLSLFFMIVGSVRSDDAIPSWQAEVVIDLDQSVDDGSGGGSLFEAVDQDGRVIAGGGFIEAYNTQDRSDRRMLSVYVEVPTPPENDSLVVERLPRPTADAGTYLFGFRGELYAFSRAGATDTRLRRWDGVRREWVIVDHMIPLSVEVGDGVMSKTLEQIRFNETVLVNRPAGAGFLGEWYHADGRLVWRQVRTEGDSSTNELVAIPWRFDHPMERTEEQATLSLTDPREFVYCFAQHADEVVVVTNMGGVHAVGPSGWRTIRAVVPNVSFQIYSSIQFADQLLLGQYPTGELFRMTNGTLERMPGSPPVMPGVRSVAREAQTLAIYAGRLWAGVWPWGEVWQSRDAAEWTFVRRMFSHPAPTDSETHPYEKQTTALDPVLNRWGQRVTSMVPIGDSLYVSTSAKSSAPYEEKFDSMTPAQADEYGSVYRLYQPGALTVPIDRTTPRSQLIVRWGADRLAVEQDGRPCGSTHWPIANLARPARITLARGIYGPSPRQITGELTVAARSKERRVFLSAYVDLSRVYDSQAAIADRESAIEAMLDRYQQAGLATVFPYANTSSGRAYFPSDVVSRHVHEDWDGLGRFIEAARARGIAVWPAVCVLASGHFEAKGILEDHPEWSLRQTGGAPWGFLSPAHPEAREWIVEFIEEIARRYKPDGLLLDYLRYFNRPYHLDPRAQADLDRRLMLMADEPERQRLRQAVHEENLSSLCESISWRARRAHPHIQIGIYTWGPHVAHDHLVAQAWPTWVQRGWIDHVNVSGYYYEQKYGEKVKELYHSRLAEAITLAGGTVRDVPVTVALGIETSHGKLTSAASIDDYLMRSAVAGVDGVSMFTWHTMAPFVDELRRKRSIENFAQAVQDNR